MYTDDMHTDFFAAVLAGGRSSRMGRDKRFLMWNQELLLDRAIRLASEVLGVQPNQVYLCGDVPGRVSLPDTIPKIGPLGGLWSALRQARRFARSNSDPWLLVLPVDMPLLDHEILMGLLAEAKKGNPDESLAIAYQDFEMPFILRCGELSEKIIEKICLENPSSLRSIRVYFEKLSVRRIPSQSFHGKLASNLNFPSDVRACFHLEVLNES
mgnify:CR=1 FL=1